MKPGQSFVNLPALAVHLRQELENKKYILLYAYNGTGKTRLSVEFKNQGKADEVRDTLYFNAFTEDLFSWDNDLEGDTERRLTLNGQSRFFSGLAELEMDNRIRPLLQRYADFDFRIDTVEQCVRFSRKIETIEDGQPKEETIDNIKVSRGEENIFIWCFFLAIVQLAMDGAEAYEWVKFIYIDDPISSLDEHNAIAVASHLAQMLKTQDHELKTVISTHHTLFFNVLCNELGRARKYFVGIRKGGSEYVVTDTGDTPFFQHVALLTELHRAAESGTLYTYHFNMLRTILEKTASFHGFGGFGDCIKREPNDPDGVFHARLINILSHGNYSLYEPREMVEENKQYFRMILNDFRTRFPFNPALFLEEPSEA
jgi:AAA domain